MEDRACGRTGLRARAPSPRLSQPWLPRPRLFALAVASPAHPAARQSLPGWQLTGTWERVAFGGLCMSVNNTGHLALDFHKSPVIKVTRGSQRLSCPVTSLAARAHPGQSSRMAPRFPASVRWEPSRSRTERKMFRPRSSETEGGLSFRGGCTAPLSRAPQAQLFSPVGFPD